ncbi:MAG: hypothetical protein LBK01_00055 [Burkholderiaceae bacterium]|nr:hypothetical protein [Burkholderiaceae bacterium]
MEPRVYERTEYDIAFDIQYGRRFCLLMGRFYGRLAAFFLFVELTASTSAFTAFLSSNNTLTGWLALTVACIAVLNVLISPGVK